MVFILYLILSLCRFVSLSLFKNTLSNLAYGMNWKEILVVSNCVARGSLSLCYSLIAINSNSIKNKYDKMILFHVSGVVFLSLLINCSMLDSFINLVGINYQSIGKDRVLYNFYIELKEDLERKLVLIKTSENEDEVKKIDWTKVEAISGSNELSIAADKLSSEIAKKEKKETKQVNQIEMKLLDLNMSVD